MRGKWERPGIYKPNRLGYYRQTICGIRKLKHHWVWILNYGEIPAGHDIHHINENPSDNRIENLELLTPKDHGRIHAGGFKDKKGRWFKHCATCDTYKLESEFYPKKRRLWRNHECKPCSVARGLKFKRLRYRRNKK